MIIDPLTQARPADPDPGAILAPSNGELEWLDGLRRLPQPLHLLEFVARSQHYHFGCFGFPEEPLRRAQDRMSILNAGRFAAGASVLDIGCGLGGTSRLLAERGLRVTALDPCHEAVAYARMRARTPGSMPRPRFVVRTLESFARTDRTSFDGALAIEILQHFPELPEFFACCRRLLRPGGILVIHDVSIHVEIDWSRVPFHRFERVRAAAEARGFRILAHQDLTREVLPTLPRLAGELGGRRRELVAGLGERHERSVERELDQILFHMTELQRAFEHGHLSYETMVLRTSEVTRCA